MKIVEVVSAVYLQASGPSYSVSRLCGSLGEAGAEVSLHVLAPAPESGDRYAIRQYPTWPGTKRLGVSPAMRRGLHEAAASSEILHNHGLWMMPNIYAGWAVQGTRCRLVVSPRGTLSAWALKRSRWLKKAMWLLGQGQTVERAVCFHATAEHEYADIRQAGFGAPVAIIPNGVDIPEDDAGSPDRGSASRRRLLFLGRLHPVKGVDSLLRVWRSLQGEHEDWELWMVGPGEAAYVKHLQELAHQIGCERVTFAGPAYGAEKSRAYRQAHLYVLPTHSENFGMTVAEALAHGVPAIVTRGAPWPGLAKEGCGWWIDIGEGPLTECLREALACPREELAAMGSRGRAWMARDFSWREIGQKMLKTYEWLLGGGEPPECVRTD